MFFICYLTLGCVLLICSPMDKSFSILWNIYLITSFIFLLNLIHKYKKEHYYTKLGNQIKYCYKMITKNKN